MTTTPPENIPEWAIIVDNEFAFWELADVKRFITSLLSQQREKERNRVVDYILCEFNDQRYAEIWGDDDSEEETEEGNAARFWMFFNPICNEARTLKEENTLPE